MNANVQNEREKSAEAAGAAEKETEAAPEAEECAESAENGAEGGGSEPDIKRLEKELSEANDRYLRIAAEYDNFRKRSAGERLRAAEDATVRAVSEFLSVADNFERASQADSADENYKKGIEMIFNQFNMILNKLGVTEIEALGAEFNPNLHHAVNQIEDESLGKNAVCEVFQKGYKLGDKVIRYAMVAVANP